jgi:hypothetical protein
VSTLLASYEPCGGIPFKELSGVWAVNEMFPAVNTTANASVIANFMNFLLDPSLRNTNQTQPPTLEPKHNKSAQAPTTAPPKRLHSEIRRRLSLGVWWDIL